MDFNMFFGILIFDPKWAFCMGYSPCMKGDIQNDLISRIFRVFWSGFISQNNSINDLKNGFSHVFRNFIF